MGASPALGREMAGAPVAAMTMQVGDLFLVSGRSWQDRCIQFAQLRRDGRKNCIWSHAAIITDTAGGLVEAAGTHGVRHNHISAYAKAKTAVLSINATDSQRQSAVAFAESCIGDQYDWLDLPSIGLNLLINDPVTIHSATRFICSAFVATALERAGYRWPRDPSDISPGDLAVLLTPRPR